MKKRRIVFLLVLALLAAAAWIPQERADVRAVVHQHRQWPAEDPEQTGFDDSGVLTTHLPIVILHTDGQTIPGVNPADQTDLYCNYSIVANPTGCNRSDDAPAQSGRMAISIRGNSSRDFAKKQYGIRLVDENQMPDDRAMLDLPPESSWVLNGSYIDRSMIRNYMLYNICSEFMKTYAPRCRLCEVMITEADGTMHYEGVYTLMEKIKVSDVRLKLTDYDPSYAETAFLMQMNSHIDSLKVEHLKPDQIAAYPFDLEYPAVEELTEDSLHYIQLQLLEFEKALYDATYTGNWEEAEKLMDLDSFVDYFLVNEFFQNYDAGTRSTYLYEDLGGKISIGPVWDFDGTFNNFFRLDLQDDIMEMKHSLLYAFLIQDPHFVERCSQRYADLRQSFLSDDYLIGYIDESVSYLGSAGVRNAERWYHNGSDSLIEDVAKMKHFVVSRGAAMDAVFHQYGLLGD